MIVKGWGGLRQSCTPMTYYLLLLLLSNKMAMDGVPNTETGKFKLIMKGTDTEENTD